MTSITSADIKFHLRERYPLTEGWVTLCEVTPAGMHSRFDAVSIMTWGSRGHEVHGFEIKVSRSDWLSELKNPAKADGLVRLCSRWWIVAPAGVVNPAELPEAWGLMTVNATGLRAVKQAPALKPEPWTPEQWRCMLLRTASQETSGPLIDAGLRKASSEGYARGLQAAQKGEAVWETRAKDAEALIARAGKETGVRITEWCDFQGLAAAFQLLRDPQSDGLVKNLERQAVTLREAAVRMRLAARTLKTMKTRPLDTEPAVTTQPNHTGDTATKE